MPANTQASGLGSYKHFLDLADQPPVMEQVLDVAAQEPDCDPVGKCNKINVGRIEDVLYKDIMLCFFGENFIYECVDEAVNHFKIFSTSHPYLYFSQDLAVSC